MAKIFDIDFRKSTLIDSVSGEQGTLTVGNGGFKNTEKGMAMKFDGSATLINYGDIVNLGTENFSFIFHFKTMGIVVGKDLIGKRGSTTNRIGYLIGINSSNRFFIEIDDGAGNEIAITGTVAVNDELWHLGIIIRDGNTLYIYTDNADEQSVNIASVGTLTNSTNLIIGKDSGTRYFSGYISKIKTYSHDLTSKERSKLYQEFLSSKPISPRNRNFITMKQKDLSREVDTHSMELITNGNFEGGFTAGIANDWTNFSNGIPTEDTGWNGTGSSQKLTLSSETGILKQTVNFLAGKTYKISGYVKTSLQDNTPGIVIRTLANIFVTTIQSMNITPDVWIYFNVDYVPSVDNISGSISLDSRTTRTMSIWMDDISVTSDFGLVAAYNMKPSAGNVLVDISGNGNNGTINGAIQTKDGIILSINEWIDGNLAGSGTQETQLYRLKKNNISGIKRLSAQTSNQIGFNGSSIFIHCDSSNGTDNNIISTALSINLLAEFDLVVIKDLTAATIELFINGISIISAVLINSKDGDFDYTTFTIGNSTTNQSADAIIYDHKIYNRVLSLQEIQAYHNSFAKETYIQDDFKNNPIG